MPEILCLRPTFVKRVKLLMLVTAIAVGHKAVIRTINKLSVVLPEQLLNMSQNTKCF